jgi:hypothetical protein
MVARLAIGAGARMAPVAKPWSEGHMKPMEQEIRRPEYVPRKHDRAVSSLNCLMAAAGLTVMMLCLLGATAAISAWAVAKLVGLPDFLSLALLVLFEIPVAWTVAWTAGRAWHIERRLAGGKDVDAPIFKVFHYFKSGTAS